jgi:hypothetical protein
VAESGVGRRGDDVQVVFLEYFVQGFSCHFFHLFSASDYVLFGIVVVQCFDEIILIDTCCKSQETTLLSRGQIILTCWKCKLFVPFMKLDNFLQRVDPRLGKAFNERRYSDVFELPNFEISVSVDSR